MPISADEFNRLWAECFFVFDSSVLLNLYEYSPQTRDDLIRLLGSDNLKDRLWFPNQVATEVFRNRVSTIHKQIKAHESTLKALRDAKRQLETERAHPFTDEAKLKQLRELIEDLEKSQSRMKYPAEQDSVLAEIVRLLEGRTGDPYTDADLQAIYKDGATRYAKKTPPGFRDDAKPEPERYGDLIIWRSMIDEVSKRNTPVIFVTSEEKDDWWQKLAGEESVIIGPRPELIQEMFDRTGQRFHMYSVQRFLKHAKQRLDPQIKQETINEVKAAVLARLADSGRAYVIDANVIAAAGGIPELRQLTPAAVLLLKTLKQVVREFIDAFHALTTDMPSTSHLLQSTLVHFGQRLQSAASELEARAGVDTHALRRTGEHLSALGLSQYTDVKDFLDRAIRSDLAQVDTAIVKLEVTLRERYPGPFWD